MAFEIEIKSLLGTKDKADALRAQLEILPGFQKLGGNTQLNHYFEGGTAAALLAVMKGKFASEKEARLTSLLSRAKTISVRSREYAEGGTKKVVFVVKTSVDDTTSSNGTAREEFEEELPRSDLGSLDALILGAGFTYQAKWSRERQEYKVGDITIAIDKNAGYGYLAEFEQVVTEASEADTVKAKLRAFMKSVGAEELDQARLARMFDFYNKNWPEYYGTDKVFTIW